MGASLSISTAVDGVGKEAPHALELGRTRARSTGGGGGLGERFHHALADLLEDHRALVDEHLGFASSAVHAEQCGFAEALHRELPRFVVEAHDGLAARASEQCRDGRAEVSEDAGSMALVDARRDVRALDEDVEHFARCVHLATRFGLSCGRVLTALRKELGGSGTVVDEYLEASHARFSARN